MYVYHQRLGQLFHQGFREEQAHGPAEEARYSEYDHRQVVHYPGGEGDVGAEDRGDVSHHVYKRHALATDNGWQEFGRVLKRDVRRHVDEQAAADRERGEGQAHRGHEGGERAEHGWDGDSREQRPSSAERVQGGHDQHLGRELGDGGDRERAEHVQAEGVQAPYVPVIAHLDNAPHWCQQDGDPSVERYLDNLYNNCLFQPYFKRLVLNRSSSVYISSSANMAIAFSQSSWNSSYTSSGILFWFIFSINEIIFMALRIFFIPINHLRGKISFEFARIEKDKRSTWRSQE